MCVLGVYLHQFLMIDVYMLAGLYRQVGATTS